MQDFVRSKFNFSLRRKVSSFSVEFIDKKVDGDHFHVPAYAHKNPASKRMLKGKFHEPLTHKFVHAILENTDFNMVHAGTFFGDMIPSFSKSCHGNVYAFEPVLENYILAKMGVDRNNLSNVILFNCGLGEHVGQGLINTTRPKGGGHSGGGSRISRSEGTYTPILTIDSLRIDNVGILQLDVEGFELPVLRGAVKTLERCSPLLMIEDFRSKCADFLIELDYVHVDKIPGLNIWSRPNFEQAARDTVALVRKSREQS